MKITIKLIGPFVYAAGFSEKEFEVPRSATVEGLLGLVAIEKDRPKMPSANRSRKAAIRSGETWTRFLQARRPAAKASSTSSNNEMGNKPGNKDPVEGSTA